jgi:ASCH domain
MSQEDLPIAEFAFPGLLRDLLVAAILTGAKTTTTGLVADYEHEGEPLPLTGLRQAVVDSAGRRVAVIETTAVHVIRLGDVGLAHALGEGEGTARSLNGGPGMNSLGTRLRCVAPGVIQNSLSTTAPSWWLRRSGYWSARGQRAGRWRDDSGRGAC